MEMIWTVVGTVEAHKLLKLFIGLYSSVRWKNWDDDDDDDDTEETYRKTRTHTHTATHTQRKSEIKKERKIRKERGNVVKPVWYLKRWWHFAGSFSVVYDEKQKTFPSLAHYVFFNKRFFFITISDPSRIRAMRCCLSFTLVHVALCNRVDIIRIDFYSPQTYTDTYAARHNHTAWILIDWTFQINELQWK